MTASFFFKILLLCAMAATVGVLVLGLLNMFNEEKEAHQRSNKMMRWRIIFQGVAILIFSLIFFLKEK